MSVSDVVLYARLNRWSNEKMSLYSFLQLLSGNVFSYFVLTPDPQGPTGPPRGPSGSNHNKSNNVTNRCCCICFSDDKNVFNIINRTPGGTREGGGCSRGSFQKLVIWKNVVKQSCSTYFSDDKNAFGVIPRPPRGSRVPPKPLGGGSF